MRTWQKYNLINTPELIQEVDEYLIKPDGSRRFRLQSFDCETNGLDLYKTSVVGFSWSVDSTRGFYLPILVWVPDLKSKKTRTIKKVKYEVFTDGKLQNIWTGKFHDEFVKPHEVDYPEWVGPLIDRWFGGDSELLMWNAPFDINQTFISFGVDLKNNLLADGGLLAHIVNENESTALKECATLYKTELGINPYAMADQEKRELKENIICNGGAGREVWRADLQPQSKYACADTFLTHALVHVLIDKIVEERGEKSEEILDWIFNKEVMPLCKEVVVDMKRRGVYIDVKHFEKLKRENDLKLLQLEDEFLNSIKAYLPEFSMGKSVSESISEQRLIKRIMQLENLKSPTTIDKKTGVVKESLAKAVVKKEYEKSPHWLWGYILGEDELKYSEARLNEIKAELYQEVEGRRYQFNLGSDYHLRWLFFEKLGENKKRFPKTDGSTIQDWTPSIDADNIKQFLLPKYPWVSTLLKYKKIKKIQSTYVEPALERNIDGWLYMDMKQNGTTSGRFSCSGGYNLQTLPKADVELEALNECHKCLTKAYEGDRATGLIELDEYIECMANRTCKQCGHVEHDILRPSAIKKGFIAPPGHKIINADYSSLEPRAFAFVSEEDNIKAVYRENLDLYAKVYCDIFDKEAKYSADPKATNFLKKLNPKARAWIKPIVLGIPYGSGDAQVANMIGSMVKYKDDDGLEQERPNMEEGKRVRDAYLSTYPKLQAYMTHQEYMAIQYGYVESKYGRRRHFTWVKTVADFFDNISHNNSIVDRVEKINAFIAIGRKKLSESNVRVSDPKSGNVLMSLTEGKLKELSSLLGLSFSIDKYGKDGVKQKGGWSYIKSLVKADLNNAKNHPIQSLAGHITNMGMLETTRGFKSKNLNSYVCLQVHDEISAYSSIEHSILSGECLQKGMEDNIFTIPLKSEVAMIAEPVICNSLKDSK